MSGGLDPAISAKLEALALASAGTQVEVMLLGVQGLPGLRGSDHAVLGICCPEQVWFQAGVARSYLMVPNAWLEHALFKQVGGDPTSGDLALAFRQSWKLLI